MLILVNSLIYRYQNTILNIEPRLGGHGGEAHTLQGVPTFVAMGGLM